MANSSMRQRTITERRQRTPKVTYQKAAQRKNSRTDAGRPTTKEVGHGGRRLERGARPRKRAGSGFDRRRESVDRLANVPEPEFAKSSTIKHPRSVLKRTMVLTPLPVQPFYNLLQVGLEPGAACVAQTSPGTDTCQAQYKDLVITVHNGG